MTILIAWSEAASGSWLVLAAGAGSAGSWPPWLAPSISVGTAMAVVIAALRAGEWKGRVDTKQEGVETRLEGVETKLESVETAIKELAKEVRADIKRLLGFLPSAVIEGGSPLRLTKLGRDVSAEVDAPSWAKNLADDLELQMRGKEPYEIQEFCFGYVSALDLSADQQRRVNQSAYDHGLPEEQVRSVMALELRDSLLARTDLEPAD